MKICALKPYSFFFRFAFSAAILAASIGPILAAEEAASFTGWKSAETKHFKFIYEDATKSQASAFAKIADSAWNDVSGIYGTPPEKTDVLVTGRTDAVNAFADGIRYYMGFYTNPPLSPEFGYREEWHKLFFTHELVHIANFSFEGKSHLAANIFGPLANAFDTIAIADWYKEGLTTVLETELTSGGRGRSPFFELYCKALTLDNAFLEYAEIGNGTRAPRGQIYVMGYILARSIADRYGISALATIERNRAGGRSFDDSVKLVTGRTCDELFRDARVSLAKKYAGERAIPEGRTISPRTGDTYYYRPALVDRQGIVTLREQGTEDMAAVRFDPETGEEKILFRGIFPDETSLAASPDGTVVAAMVTRRYDRAPGYSANTDLYSWHESTGLVRLTSGTSLFEPALSGDGKKLVAVELAGNQYRLVEVDPANGKRRVLLESPTESYIQPALSADGSSIAFLALTGKRAVLATAPMPTYDVGYPVPQNSVTRAFNATGDVVDIANPSWTKDGSLLFASNERGRLEIWELKDGARSPVVSDPAGATWATVTDEGICYASYAGSGNVIKMKPASEWGKVPSFNGPSMPGSIVTLGALASDYPNFNPYPTKVNADPAKAAEKTPVLRQTPGKKTETIDALQNEKKYLNVPKPLLWFPTISSLSFANEDPAFGAGAFAILSGYPLQNGMADTTFAAGGTWFPKINQANAFAFASIPAFTGSFVLLGSREIATEHAGETFMETTTGELSFAKPIESVYFYLDHADIAVVAGVSGVSERKDSHSFSADAKGIPCDRAVNLKAGIDFTFAKEVALDMIEEVHGSTMVIASSFPSISRKNYAGTEASAIFRVGSTKVQGELSAKTRWFDYPESAPLPSTIVNLRRENLDCLYPSRTILGAGLVFPGTVSWNIFTEKLVSAGKNSAGMNTPDNDRPFNLTIAPDWYAGLELEAVSGRTRVAFGLVSRFDDEAFDPASDLRLYLTVKLDAIEGVWN